MYHDPNLMNARVWAHDVLYNNAENTRKSLDDDHDLMDSSIYAVAELIEELPDTIINGGRLRDIINAHYTGETQSGVPVAALEDLFPHPPTLLDLDKDERHHYIGQDVHVDGWVKPGTLMSVHGLEAGVLNLDSKPHPTVDVHPLGVVTPVAEHEHEDVFVAYAEPGTGATISPDDFNIDYIYKDVADVEWEFIVGAWVWGDTRKRRQKNRIDGLTEPVPPTVFAPYTPVRKKTSAI